MPPRRKKNPEATPEVTEVTSAIILDAPFEKKEETNMADINDILGLGASMNNGPANDTNSAPPFGSAFEDDSVFGDGMFEDVDFESIPDDPFQLPPNTYIFRVSSAKMQAGKDNSDNGGKDNSNRFSIAMVYEVIEGTYKNRKVREWLHYPSKKDGVDEDKKIIALSIMKTRLTAMGYDLDSIKRFNHRNYQEMMIGRTFAGTTYNQKDQNNPEQTNVRFNKTVPLSAGNTAGSSVDFSDYDI